MSFTPDYVCTNPNCKSYGHAHPNCRCDAPGEYAHGGTVHFCSHNKLHASDCEHFANGDEVVANHEFHHNPDLAIDHAALNHGLHHTLTKTGKTKSETPGRVSSDFLGSARKGSKSVQSHSREMLESKSERIEPNEEGINSLHSHIQSLRENPDMALETGGNLGDTFPFHHAALAAKTAVAVNYLESIKPQPSQAGPLDRLLPPSRSAEKNYRRQVALAENPRLIFQHAKDGTLIPQDFQTLEAIYPKLRAKIQDHAFQTLAEAKASGKNLTHAQKRRLGALVGQHLTFIQSPQSCQAIMNANKPQQMPQPANQKSPKKATNVELKQINKVQELSETPLQRLQAGHDR